MARPTLLPRFRGQSYHKLITAYLSEVWVLPRLQIRQPAALELTSGWIANRGSFSLAFVKIHAGPKDNASVLMILQSAYVDDRIIILQLRKETII